MVNTRKAFKLTPTDKDKRIEELEKEVTELKGEADSVLNNWCKGDDPCPHLKKRDDKLIKAKEIIKNLMKFAEIDNREYEPEYKEAEKFLKDCEVEK